MRLCGKPLNFSIDDALQVTYLNVYNGSNMFHDNQGYLKAPLSGPQYLPQFCRKKSIQFYLKKFQCTSTSSVRHKSVTAKAVAEHGSLLHSLMRLSNESNDTYVLPVEVKVMDNRGAHLVIIEGSIQSLKNFSRMGQSYTKKNGKKGKKKPFLVPFACDAMSGLGHAKFEQRFHVKKDPNPLKGISDYGEHLDDFDKVFCSDSEFCGAISSTCYDMSKYKNGLIFAFRRNDDMSIPTIVEECSLPKQMQPNDIFCEYNAVVMSEWFKHKDFHSVSEDVVKVVQKVHGQSGFGNRSRSSCAGTNVYEGKRQTLATVGNPL